MKKPLKILVFSVFALFLVAGGAHAELIGVQLGLPDILSDQTGNFTYDADSNLFTIDAVPLTITFDDEKLFPIIAERDYRAQFYVDESGDFAGGVAGDDLRIVGKVIDPDTLAVVYDGLLVAGEVNDFGWQIVTGGTGDQKMNLDFTFDFTGGLLASYYALTENLGANFTVAEELQYLGDSGQWLQGWDDQEGWNSTHKADKVKNDTAPVPEPATMLLIGSGLIGMAGLGRRKLFGRN